MPVQSPRTASVARLADQLSARLKADLSLDEPFIVERRIPQTRSRHVLVIWDAWRKLPDGERATIISNAYDSADRLKGDTIRVAMVRKTDRVDVKNLRKVLEVVGGVQVKVGASLQVRFPSQEYAEEAYRRLSVQVPGPCWAITKEVAQIGQA